MMDLDCLNIWREIIKERVFSTPVNKKTTTQVKPTKAEKKAELKFDAENQKFAADLMALCGHDKKLSEAIEHKVGYRFEIDLKTLFDLCPRSARKKDRYASLVRYLSTLDIRMDIVSSAKGDANE